MCKNTRNMVTTGCHPGQLEQARVPGANLKGPLGCRCTAVTTGNRLNGLSVSAKITQGLVSLRRHRNKNEFFKKS